VSKDKLLDKKFKTLIKYVEYKGLKEKKTKFKAKEGHYCHHSEKSSSLDDNASMT